MKIKSVRYLLPLDRLPLAKDNGRIAATGPPLPRRLARCLDRVITAHQEWLEVTDLPLAKVLAAAPARKAPPACGSFAPDPGGRFNSFGSGRLPFGLRG